MAQQTKDSDLRVDSVRIGSSGKRTRQTDERKTFAAQLRSRIHLPQDSVTRGLLGMIVLTILAAMAGIWFYNRVHLFESYRIVQSTEELTYEPALVVLGIVAPRAAQHDELHLVGHVPHLSKHMQA